MRYLKFKNELHAATRLDSTVACTSMPSTQQAPQAWRGEDGAARVGGEAAVGGCEGGEMVMVRGFGGDLMRVVDGDTELVELAAFAVGLTIKWSEHLGCYERYVGPLPEPFSQWLPWRPISEDADAFRLAVALNISINRPVEGDSHHGTRCSSFDQQIMLKIHDKDAGDPYKATRRAIVITAAEVGRRIKSPAQGRA